MTLVIDNYDSFTYNLVQMLGERTGEVRVVRNDAYTLEELLAWNPACAVLSPGPGTPEAAGMTVAFVRAAAARRLPVLGVCLGHQAIAVAFGGRIVPAPRLMHGKQDRIRHRGEGLLAGLDDGFPAGRYHSLAVDVAGVPELIVDGWSDDGTVMSLRHRELPIYGIQFHPESVLTPDGGAIIDRFLAQAYPGSRKTPVRAAASRGQ
ncbi:MAG: aminodeoxychorismate/anthranilate synthase component II [Firmicutes bacterium]|nr:aminodeoxychorismate/anthranilate synthase component II [Bacillota bacterium]